LGPLNLGLKLAKNKTKVEAKRTEKVPGSNKGNPGGPPGSWENGAQSASKRDQKGTAPGGINQGLEFSPKEALTIRNRGGRFGATPRNVRASIRAIPLGALKAKGPPKGVLGWFGQFKKRVPPKPWGSRNVRRRQFGPLNLARGRYGKGSTGKVGPLVRRRTRGMKTGPNWGHQIGPRPKSTSRGQSYARRIMRITPAEKAKF